jgi:hypothetical protein
MLHVRLNVINIRISRVQDADGVMTFFNLPKLPVVLGSGIYSVSIRN